MRATSPDPTQIVVRLQRSPAMARALATIASLARDHAYIVKQRAATAAKRSLAAADVQKLEQTSVSLNDVADLLEDAAREANQ